MQDIDNGPNAFDKPEGSTMRLCTSKSVFRLDDYMKKGIMKERHALELQSAIQRRDTILIGGDTCTGKTTLINALLLESKEDDRCCVVEEGISELQCSAPNYLMLLVQPPVYSWRRALGLAVRQHPTPLIVNDIAWDGRTLELLIKAWGYPRRAGLGTLHVPVHASRNENGEGSVTAWMLDRICQVTAAVDDPEWHDRVDYEDYEDEDIVYPMSRQMIAHTINLAQGIQPSCSPH